MREIKFRAWHKETGAFLKIWPYNWQNGVYTNGKPNKYFDNKFQFSEDNKECNRIEGKSCFLTVDGSIIGILPIDNLTHKTLDYSDEYILSQFIGLKDKQGKEIYEGDIVDGFFVDQDNETYLFTDVVSFAYGKFQCSNNADFDLSVYDLTIIGNIYENESLLK